jgi:hypothetical protein
MATTTNVTDQLLLTKEQLAERLGLKVRGVESLVLQRKIPVLRISGRCVRFSWPRVLAALQKFEEKELPVKLSGLLASKDPLKKRTPLWKGPSVKTAKAQQAKASKSLSSADFSSAGSLLSIGLVL